MGKVYTRFQTKTVEKPHSLGNPTPPRFGQIVVQIVSVRVKKLKLNKTNLVASMHIKRAKASVTVDVRRSKTVLLREIPIYFRLTSGWLPGCSEASLVSGVFPRWRPVAVKTYLSYINFLGTYPRSFLPLNQKMSCNL